VEKRFQQKVAFVERQENRRGNVTQLKPQRGKKKHLRNNPMTKMRDTRGPKKKNTDFARKKKKTTAPDLFETTAKKPFKWGHGFSKRPGREGRGSLPLKKKVFCANEGGGGKL